jgi:REP element-mobilizing transposase RayT
MEPGNNRIIEDEWIGGNRFLASVFWEEFPACLSFRARFTPEINMVVGYHLIWTAYGWWLPNDPRGSSSHEIRVETIATLGDLHHGRNVVQPRSAEIRRFYAQAGDDLKHPLLTFSGDDLVLVGASFAQVIRERGYTCYACAIMPEHVHLLIRRHRDWAEVMTESLQKASRQILINSKRRAPTHPVWGGPGWKVFLNTQQDMERIVRYIQHNPVKAGCAKQQWDFVKDYDGWMPAYRR